MSTINIMNKKRQRLTFITNIFEIHVFTEKTPKIRIDVKNMKTKTVIKSKTIKPCNCYNHEIDVLRGFTGTRGSIPNVVVGYLTKVQ